MSILNGSPTTRLQLQVGYTLDGMVSTRRSRFNSVTIKEVAARAGVHSSTVSRALNLGKKRVSSELVDRVVSAANELGYRPNALARALRLEKTLTVGMLIPDILNPIYAPIVRGVEDTLRASGMSVLVGSSDNDITRELELLEVMIDRRVDGLLVATATRDYPLLEPLIRDNIPLVLVNRSPDNCNITTVCGNDELGIYEAVAHLFSLGHHAIVHLAGTSSVSTGVRRRKAFISAMAEYDLPVQQGSIFYADDFGQHVGIELGVLLGCELLKHRHKFTAVVAANDLFAVGCYDVLKNAGVRVPEDVSIVGYHDLPLVDRLSPALTTVHQPNYEIGAHAGQAIMHRIGGATGKDMSLALAPHLVVRSSTAPART